MNRGAQVSGEGLLKGLKAALEAAPDAAAAAPLLAAYSQAAKLAGVARLDALCHGFVAALAAAVGLGAPAPPGTPAEDKQLAALQVRAPIHSVPVCEAGRQSVMPTPGPVPW